MIINRYVQDEKVALLAITETWLKKDDNEVTSLLTPDGYKLISLPRSAHKGKRGGGLGLLYRNTFFCERKDIQGFDCMEVLCVRLTGHNTRQLDLYILYHTSSLGTQNKFLGQLEQLFDYMIRSTVPFVLLGDFNIWCDVPKKSAGLQQRLNLFNLTQHVKAPTRGVHILDLVITRSSDQFVTHLSVVPLEDPRFDHHSVSCILSLEGGPPGHAPHHH